MPRLATTLTCTVAAAAVVAVCLIWPVYGPLVSLLAVIVVSVWLGALAQRAIRRGSFLKGYFLGNRGLGAWTLALTATVQSGGTFMGFPSLVYSYGWIVTLWIGSYMLVPLMSFGLLAKRFAQLSRRTEAITVPDFLDKRFASPAVGLAASLAVMLFMSVMMVAQFKAGAIVMKLAWPFNGAEVVDTSSMAGVESSAAAEMSEEAKAADQRAYWIGLTVFSLTVVGYTLIGGFLASVWTDLFQSVLMLAGVALLFLLIVPLVPGPKMEQATRDVVERVGPDYAFGPGSSTTTVGYSTPHSTGAASSAAGIDEGIPAPWQFLPLGLAVSFFFVWCFGGVGSPASLVRVMACRDTPTIRRSLVLLSVYNLLIYLPLIVICVHARAALPSLPTSDEVIPRLAMWSTREMFGGALASGLILAAPFGAVMATVSTYLVVIASSLVRDVYLRHFRPFATQRELRLVTYSVMIAFGLGAVAANIRPVNFLQAIVVFSGSGTAATLLVPALMAAYWRRATAAGAMAAMIAGAVTTVALFALGWAVADTPWDQHYGLATSFRPYFLLGLEPIVWGLVASSAAGVLVSLWTRPPDAALVSQLFDEPSRAA